MNRFAFRTCTVNLIIAIALILGTMADVQAQGPIEEPYDTVTITPYNDHIYLVDCIGGQEFGQPPFSSRVLASVGDDGILLIDAGFASTCEVLKRSLTTISDSPVKIIINTHHHGDHAFGNVCFADQTVTIGHIECLNSLSGDYFSFKGDHHPATPQIGVEDNMVVRFNGEEIRAVHTVKTHSSTDLYVYFPKSKLVAVGDLVFPDEFPYVHLRNGGTAEGYLKQIVAFISDFPDDVTFVSAHGRNYNKEDLRAYAHMLSETIRLVRAVSESQTIDAVLAADPLADWKDWNGSFPTTTTEAWIQTLYTETTGGLNWLTSVCEPLTEVLVDTNATEAIKLYRELKETKPEDFEYGENELNMLGYQLLFRERVSEAAEIFKLNTEMFPDAANPYDSYGEVLLMIGDTTASIANYEKSLELNPENTNAAAVLERIKAE